MLENIKHNLNMATTVSMVWWFSSDGNRLLFKKDFADDFVVQSVKAGPKKKTLDILLETENPEVLQKTTVQLTTFKAVDDTFKDLTGIKKRSSFIKCLQDITDDNDLEFDNSEDDNEDDIEPQATSAPSNSKGKKYIHTSTFFEEVIMMRELHPQRNTTSFLQSGNSHWRKECMTALEFDPKKMGAFGGHFREQLYVATMPHSCFEMVKELNQSFLDGEVKCNFKKTKMTAGVFQCLVGYKNEGGLRGLLTQLVDGEVSLSEFRQMAKEHKSEQREEKLNVQTELVRLRAEVGRLSRENNRLVSMLQEKEKETEETMDQEDQEEELFPVGSIVEAFWAEDKFWYAAKILKITAKGYAVQFTDDNVKRTLSKKNIRK